jgi:hypothetical protein
MSQGNVTLHPILVRLSVISVVKIGKLYFLEYFGESSFTTAGKLISAEMNIRRAASACVFHLCMRSGLL